MHTHSHTHTHQDTVESGMTQHTVVLSALHRSMIAQHLSVELVQLLLGHYWGSLNLERKGWIGCAELLSEGFLSRK